MSPSSTSLLDKLKEIFSKLFKSKKSKNSSFKTPQDLQQNRYGTTPDDKSSEPPRLPEISQTSAVDTDHSDLKAAEASQPAAQPIPRIEGADTSADVSPTEPRTYRADRPPSEAVSALEQDEVSDQLDKSVGAAGVQEAELKQGDIAPTDSVHTAQSSVNGDQLEHVSEPQVEQPHTNGAAIEKLEQAPAKEAAGPETLPADRVDPTTAPEVVNEFDDEKVPVIAEPPATAHADTKFRMSATSGPLEDFPAGGEYYTQ